MSMGIGVPGDKPATDDMTQPWSLVSLIKALILKWIAGLTVSGTVNVGNWPGTQPVSGAVSVSNLPAIPAGSNTIGKVDQGTAGTAPWLVQESRAATLLSKDFSLAATGQVVAAVANKSIRVYSIKLMCSAALSVKWQSHNTDLEGAQPYLANDGYVEIVNPPNYLFSTASGEELNLNISGVGTASGRVSYWTE